MLNDPGNNEARQTTNVPTQQASNNAQENIQTKMGARGRGWHGPERARGRGSRGDRGRGNRGGAAGLGFLVRPRGSFNPGFGRGGREKERGEGNREEERDLGRSYTQNPSYQRNIEIDERSQYAGPSETGTRPREYSSRPDQNWPEPTHYQRREPYVRRGMGRDREDPFRN